MSERFIVRKGVIILFAYLFLYSCYSFTGSSLAPDVKTIKINTFSNNTPFNPDLSQQFTLDLQNKFLQKTNLKGASQNPDILIEGEIIDYQISPTSISSATTSQTGGLIQAAQNKLTVTVRVHYENSKYPKDSFNKNYSDDAVFDNSLSTQEIESTQVKIATERIINKIFNDIVANW